MACDEGLEDLCEENCGGTDFVEIAIDEDEVSVVAGQELAFVLFFELGVGRTLRVGG